MLDGASRMGQPLPDWPSESGVNAVCCCSAAEPGPGWAEGGHALSGRGSQSRNGGDLTVPGLRPPPLFRSLGLRDSSSASLPPHRRLRSMFYRPRAVLPDCGHHGLSSWKDSSSKLFTFREAHMSPADGKKSHSNSAVETCMSGPPESSMPADDKEKGFPWERETRSLSLTGIKTELPLQWCGEASDTGHSARAPARGRGRWSSSVCPESWSEQQSGWRRREKQQAQRAQRKRRSGGRQRDPHKSTAASAAPDRHQEEAGLCQWLQSLGFAAEQKDPPTANRRQSAFGGEVPRPCFEERLASHRGWMAESDAQPVHQRRDRRPHFLPPIPQTNTTSSSSLLDVPLLLPENSPPPSRCDSPEPPCSPLAVPLLSHIPLPLRKKRDFKTLF